MNKNSKFQKELDEFHHKQYVLEQKLEEISDDYRQLTAIQEEVLSAQGSAHFHFQEILDFGLSKSNESFYQDLVSDIEVTTRDLEISLEDQLSDLKKQSQKYQKNLDSLLKERKKLIEENEKKEDS